MEIKEEWRDIEDYAGLYQISNLGRVKSLNYNRTKKEKILKNRKIRNGYLQVILYKNGNIKPFQVHRLVAQAFIENPKNLPMINHKDENKQNNCIDNLEWCDANYNTNYGSRNDRTAKTLSKPILQFDKNMNFIKRWDSATEVKRELGFSQQHISQCCLEKRKSANGYIWKYDDKKIDLENYRKVS